MKVEVGSWPLIPPEKAKLEIENPFTKQKYKVEVQLLYPGNSVHAGAVAYSDSFLYVHTSASARKRGAHVGLFATVQGIEPFTINVLSNSNIRMLLYVKCSDPWNVYREVVLPLARKDVTKIEQLLKSLFEYNAKKVAERLCKQLTVVPFNIAVLVPKSSAQFKKIFIGSMEVEIPEDIVRTDEATGKLVIDLVKKSAWSVSEVAAVVEAFAAAAAQEKENSVIFKTEVGNVEVYDPGALAEDYEEFRKLCEQVAEKWKTAKRKLESMLAEAAATTSSTTMVGGVKRPDIIESKPNALVVVALLSDHVVVFVHASDLFTGYLETLKKIYTYGIEIETRHGKTRDICYYFVYERLPRVRLIFDDVEKRYKVIELEEPPEEVREIVYAIAKRTLNVDYLKKYIEDNLNVAIPEADYTYGERLFAWGHQYKWVLEYSVPKQRFAPIVSFDLRGLIMKLAETVPLVNQLDLVVERITRDKGARYALAITWDPWTDTTGGIRDQPCWILFQFRLLGNRLVTYTYCRSHDFARAHIENMYLVAAIVEYVRMKLEKRLGEKIELGSCMGEVASCHVYV